ncbi:hypothetical protein [Luteipulveratus mongoliensis]|uniref:Uncharacterized protein n=1 Tax=Luteipulveratus mongoliensis TaxID=571913 RepID=A0A0K1JI06_9MICO|nr:hypothetical protein [Luteipulveratus mongoliensis]AKU16210.1 hypothetical protein VV02_10630 [Luteipulveratus mongoliensis]
MSQSSHSDPSGDTDPSGDGVRLIGGEMPQQRDLPAAALGALEELVLAAVPSGARRVLLAGPRASVLAPALRDREVAALVRGLPDATSLADAGVIALCGGLDRLAADAGYDLVVVLDPPEVLLTPDSPGLSHTDMLGVAADALAADGALIALVANGIGLDTLSAVPAPRALADDRAWWVGTSGYDVRRPFHHELRSLLEDAGLHLWAGRSVLPSLASPVVTVDSQDEEGRTSAVETLAASVHRVEGADRAIDAIEAGAARDLAAGWLLVAGHVPSTVMLPAVTPSSDAGSGATVSSESTLVSRRLPLLRALRDGNLARTRVLLADLRGAYDDENACGVALVELGDQVAGAAGAHPFAPELDAQGVTRELRALAGLTPADGPEPATTSQGASIAASDSAQRVAELTAGLRDRSGQVQWLQRKVSEQERRIRALEHAIGTADGPLPRRVLLVMTAPTHRLVEAARSRVKRRPS